MGGDANVPCDLLTLLMVRHAGVGVGWGGTPRRGWGGGDGNVPCDLLSLLMLRHEEGLRWGGC